MPEYDIRPILNPWVVGGLIGLLLILLAFGPPRSKTNVWQRLTLALLRFGAIVVLFFVMLRPYLIYTETKQHPATLVVLADISKSMQVTDMVGNKSRWQEFLDQWKNVSPELAQLEKEVTVKVYQFSRETQPVAATNGIYNWPTAPTGEESALGAALKDVLRQEAGQRLHGILLFSDGAQRARGDRDVRPLEPAAQMQKLGAKIYTFGFGQPVGLGQARDVAVLDLNVNPSVFVKNKLPVASEVRIDGYVNKSVPIEMLFESPSGKMEVVETRTLQPTESGDRFKLNFQYLPETPGEWKVTVRAKPQQGELLESNNELSTFVTVQKGGINVLYLEGVPRTEQKFIRWSLGASPNVQVDYHEIDATSSQPFPPGAADWFLPGKYDVLILGDLDSQAFSKQMAEALAERVHGGMGLMMLGGFHSFGPGGYLREPFADLLPVVMSRLERQAPNEPIRKDLHLLGPQTMLPTPDGERHFCLLLGDPTQNRKIWEKLPPLEGANKFGSLKGLAQVLAQNQDGKPLLVMHEVGGRVLAFAGDSTWRWWMRGNQTEHRRFWRQVVLWLARKDATEESGVWVRLAQRRFLPGQRVEVRAGAQSAEGQPIPNAEITAELKLPDGTTRTQNLSREGADLVGSFFETELPGDYAVQVFAKQAGKLLGSARARFLVQSQDLELSNPAADLALLDSLAQATSGEALVPEQLAGLLARLRQQGLRSQIQIQTKVDLYDNGYVLLLFVLFLSLEWFLRKRWLLV